MALHRLSSLVIGIPEPTLAASRNFFRELGLSEVAPARFATSDGAEQLALVAAPRRGLAALTVGVDDADDLGRVAASLAKLGVEAARDGETLRTREPVTGIRITLAVEPRLVQKPNAPLTSNTPGRTVRRNDRSPAGLAARVPKPRGMLKCYKASQAATFTVGNGPSGIAFDGANIWVANEASDTVTKL